MFVWSTVTISNPYMASSTPEWHMKISESHLIILTSYYSSFAQSNNEHCRTVGTAVRNPRPKPKPLTAASWNCLNLHFVWFVLEANNNNNNNNNNNKRHVLWEGCYSDRYEKSLTSLTNPSSWRILKYLHHVHSSSSGRVGGLVYVACNAPEIWETQESTWGHANEGLNDLRNSFLMPRGPVSRGSSNYRSTPFSSVRTVTDKIYCIYSENSQCLNSLLYETSMRYLYIYAYEIKWDKLSTWMHVSSDIYIYCILRCILISSHHHLRL